MSPASLMRSHHNYCDTEQALSLAYACHFMLITLQNNTINDDPTIGVYTTSCGNGVTSNNTSWKPPCSRSLSLFLQQWITPTRGAGVALHSKNKLLPPFWPWHLQKSCLWAGFRSQITVVIWKTNIPLSWYSWNSLIQLWDCILI